MKKLKLKKGDFVRVDPPMLGKIKRINKEIGYTIEVFASPKFDVAYYDDTNVYKVSKKSNWAKNSIKSAKKKINT